MKVMSREFTTTEKVLIVILGIVLLGLLYYKFVYLTTEDMISANEAEIQSTQAELDVAKAKLDKLNKIEGEMDAIGASSKTSRMESYNNSKRETAFLNRVLSGVKDYSVTFSEVTRNGEQIRRSFELQFVTNSYKSAENTVSDLTTGQYRCLVDDIDYSLNDNNESYVNLTATFFETMVGGTPDPALPKDEGKNGEGDDTTESGTEE